jgi:hypothetical protein
MVVRAAGQIPSSNPRSRFSVIASGNPIIAAPSPALGRPPIEPSGIPPPTLLIWVRAKPGDDRGNDGIGRIDARRPSMLRRTLDGRSALA